ncbi:hypothetical protein N658DRAFT_509136 [Parathielavia hyrcaniae]|uniref:Uncharacterized protein n=1 Tax=Parathielavia hyrcaniae TaxID=113614 RepID=A0AAN6PVS1_9PEZI|nr:hypothetical protein N658DRAFT_509136 [Parathielavia hyrcaniae]
MKYNTAILSLLIAVASATRTTTLPTTDPGAEMSSAVARDTTLGEEVGEHHRHSMDGTKLEDLGDGLEKRKGAGGGGRGGGGRSSYGGGSTYHHGHGSHRSDATTALVNVMGVLVAGMAWAGVGAFFL